MLSQILNYKLLQKGLIVLLTMVLLISEFPAMVYSQTEGCTQTTFKPIQESGVQIPLTLGNTNNDTTFEDIDPVRVITNKSSGKMGNAIAEQAYLRGADVLLLRGHISVELHYNIQEEKFTTVNDLFNKIRKNIKNFEIVIHAAAVSDFELNNKSDKKIKSHQELHLELTPTTKILENLKKLNKKIFLVGFLISRNSSFNLAKPSIFASVLGNKPLANGNISSIISS